MKFLLYSGLLLTSIVLPPQSAIAQPVVTHSVSSIRRPMTKVDENTRIFDKNTGQPLSYQAYQALLSKDPYGYHAEPIIDKYGKVSAYTIRPTTPEERETHRFRYIHPELRPKSGEPFPEFVMKGVDDKEYRATELKGQVIVLSFWVSLSQPFWNPNQAASFAQVLRSQPSVTEPISLGLLQESKEAIVNRTATDTLPFVPIPDSYGFNQRYQVTTVPSFIVIDRTGNVAAFIEGARYDQVREAIQKASR